MLKMTRPLGLLAALVALAPALLAQTTAPAPEKAPPSELKITLMDGSVVTGKFSVPELAMETKFGALKIPIDQIQSFSPGIKSHPDFENKLTGLVNDLAADAFADREKAQQAIMKLGPEIKPELERQVKLADAEKQMRLQKILEEFEGMRGDDEGADLSKDWRQDDVIVTPGFTVVGRISTPGFSVTSPYGTLQVKMNDIRMARRDAAEPEEIRKSVTVPGSTMANRTYINTNLRLQRGDVVTFTATGQVTMSPWGNNSMCTPDGNQRYGMVLNNIFSGTLVGRMNGGEMFKVGAKSTFTAPKAGTLELSIAIQSDYSGNQFPGEYQVKMVVVRKPEQK